MQVAVKVSIITQSLRSSILRYRRKASEMLLGSNFQCLTIPGPYDWLGSLTLPPPLSSLGLAPPENGGDVI